MSRSFAAVLLLLWSVFGVAADVDDQPRLAPTDAQEFSAAAALTAEELPDDLDAARSDPPLPATRAPSVRAPGGFEPSCSLAAAHRARGPPDTFPV